MNGPLNRDDSLRRIHDRVESWDAVIIGGGATGVAAAMDAAARGLDVLLLERFDFGKGTSSRSTKLVHGGVRYLEQGNITLVRDALQERTLLLNHAPHLVHDRPFLIPCRSLWQWFFYGVGLKVYDLLAVRNSFGRSRFIRAKTAIEMAPGLSDKGLRGAVEYHDGQFDDARLLINMARTAADHGGCLVNYMAVESFTRGDSGELSGVVALDAESKNRIEVKTRCVVNAAGPFGDEIRRIDQEDCESMIAASQGVHLVLPPEFFPGDTAMIVPKTSDGRVIFIIPWHGHAVVGTTDTAIPNAVVEPAAQEQEIEFLLQTASDYLSKAPKRSDVLSVFTGIRPLVKGDKSANTASLSRDHVIRRSDSGMLTITGGKWTTVRKMAEDCVDAVLEAIGETDRPCKTKTLSIHGAMSPSDDPRAVYGSDLDSIRELERESPELAEAMHAELPIHRSEVVWAVREEMARTVEDVLARRTRCLFLNTQASLQIAPEIARLMQRELGRDDAWAEQQVSEFQSLAKNYQV